jgi:ABC-2 type transport system permease protein
VIGAYSLGAAGLGLCLGSLVRSPERAQGLAIVASLFMSAIGGCWWPLEIVPEWLRFAGHVFPTAWGIDALHILLAWGGGVGDVLPQVAALLAYAVVFVGIGAKSLRLT